MGVPAQAVILSLYCFGTLALLAQMIWVARRDPRFILLTLGLMSIFPWVNGRVLSAPFGCVIYAPDILTIIALLAGLLRARLVGLNLGGKLLLPWLVLAALTLNLARGLVVFGPAAINQARPFLSLTAVAFYFLSFDMKEWGPSVLRYLRWTASALVILAIAHWSSRGLGSADTMLVDEATNRQFTSRILIGSQTFILALGGLVALYRALNQRRHVVDFVLPVLALGTVVLAQHRSVWIAGLIGLGVLVAAAHARFRIRALIGGAIVGAILVPALALGSLGSVTSSLTDSYSSASLNEGTFSDRRQSWRILIARSGDEGAASVLIGAPFGDPYSRVIEGRLEEYSPHSWYVSLYLRLGLLGSLAVAILLVQAGRRAASPLPRQDLRWGLLAAMLVYSLAYSLDTNAAPLLALLLCRSEPLPGQDWETSDPPGSTSAFLTRRHQKDHCS